MHLPKPNHCIWPQHSPSQHPATIPVPCSIRPCSCLSTALSLAQHLFFSKLSTCICPQPSHVYTPAPILYLPRPMSLFKLNLSLCQHPLSLPVYQSPFFADLTPVYISTQALIPESALATPSLFSMIHAQPCQRRVLLYVHSQSGKNTCILNLQLNCLIQTKSYVIHRVESILYHIFIIPHWYNGDK